MLGTGLSESNRGPYQQAERKAHQEDQPETGSAAQESQLFFDEGGQWIRYQCAGQPVKPLDPAGFAPHGRAGALGPIDGQAALELPAAK